MPEPNKEKLTQGMLIALVVIVILALLGLGVLAGRATTGGSPSYQSGPPPGSPPGASSGGKTYQVTEEDLRDWGEVQRLRERQKVAGENYERFGR